MIAFAMKRDPLSILRHSALANELVHLQASLDDVVIAYPVSSRANRLARRISSALQRFAAEMETEARQDLGESAKGVYLRLYPPSAAESTVRKTSKQVDRMTGSSPARNRRRRRQW